MTADDTTPARVAAAAEALAEHVRLSWAEEPFTCACQPTVSDATGPHHTHAAAAVVAALDAQPGDAEQAGGLAARLAAIVEDHRGNRSPAYAGADNYVPIYVLDDLLAGVLDAQPDDGTAERALAEVEERMIRTYAPMTWGEWRPGEKPGGDVYRVILGIVREVRAAADTGHQGGKS